MNTTARCLLLTLAELIKRPVRQINHGMQRSVDVTKHPLDYQRPSVKQTRSMEYLAPFFKATWEAILDVSPNCAERTLALRKLQECRMWANCGIVFSPDDELDVQGVALDESESLPGGGQG